MNNHIYLTQHSLNPNQSDDGLLRSITELKALFKKYQSAFIVFNATPGFYEFIATTLLQRQKGFLMSQIYDGLQLGNSEIDDLTVTEITKSHPPVHDKNWLAIFSSEREMSNNNEGNEEEKEKGKEKTNNNTIDGESSLVRFCTKNLTQNNYTANDYANYFPMVYRNLYFRGEPGYAEAPTYAHLNKMTPPFNRFIQTITQCLSLLNNYNVIPENADENIIKLNNLLPVSVTREGKGKANRQAGELKRDFVINDQTYPGINCEYHAKFTFADNQRNAATNYYNRMYFGFIQFENSASIAIAHIGDHW